MPHLIMPDWKALILAKRLYRERNKLIVRALPTLSFPAWQDLPGDVREHFLHIAKTIPVTLYGKGKAAHTGYNVFPYAIKYAEEYLRLLDIKQPQ